ncbi:MAG: PorT family protein [Tannerellaceae bacterium]|nr:PorT family protein [Tannerellaceae bacterium]
MKKNSMNKVVNVILIVFLFSLLGMSAQAQYARSNTYGFNGEAGWRLGVKLGPNFAGFTGKGSEDLGGRVGVHAGMFAEYVMPGNLYIQTGLELSLKGAKETYSDEYEKLKFTANPLYLQIPIHLGYQIGVADDISVNIHAGPYLAFGIGGKWKFSYEDKSNSGYDFDEDESWNFFGSEDEDGCKAVDFGLGFGIDLDLSSFRIGLGCDAGLVNIDRDKDNPLKNRNFYLSLGYKF